MNEVRVYVSNWRCIAEADFSLSRINIFMGPNSVGKSSLAYAVYFAIKSLRRDPKILLSQLYGCDFKEIARREKDKPIFPIKIGINGLTLSIEEEEDRINVKRSGGISIWRSTYLLPSRRIGYLQALTLLPKLLREIRAKPEAEVTLRVIGSWIGGLIEVFKGIPLFPPLPAFLSDYNEALEGRSLEYSGRFGDAGRYIMSISPLLLLIDLIYEDPYTKLRLPTELAPDGILDMILFDTLTKNIKDSLLVIEEPEIHKNPVKIVEFTEHIVDRVLNNNLTIIMTTHTEIIPLTIAQLIVKGEAEINARDVKIYYFTRDPWTRLSEVKIYEDGTLEGLPDVEKITEHLF